VRHPVPTYSDHRMERGKLSTVRVWRLPQHQARATRVVLRLGTLCLVSAVSAAMLSTALGTPAVASTAHVRGSLQLAPGTIFVANAGVDNGGTGTGSVTEFSATQTGNVHPVATLSRGLNGPYGLAFDASGDLWVANNLSNTLVEYQKSDLAKASPTPSVTISSVPGDVLNSPAGIAFDSSGNLWVDNNSVDTVTEYTKAQLTRSGAPVPRVTITNEALFGQAGPYGVAVDPSGDLWVEGSPNDLTDAFCEYPRAQLAKSGTPAPRATISPGYQLWDLTFDSSGNAWVPNFYGNTLVEYPEAVLAEGGSPRPKLTILSPSKDPTLLDNPADLAFDHSGNLWLLNTGDQTLVEYTRAELTKSGSPMPVRIIAGSATGMNSASYLAIEP